MTSLQSSSNTSPRQKQLAKHACVPCTKRKKGCDKRVPQCSHCQRRGIDCEYASVSKPRTKFIISPLQASSNKDASASFGSDTPASSLNSSTSVAQPLSLVKRSDVADPALSLCRRICEILDRLGHHTDELCHKYFHGLYTCFPFISQESFHRSLVCFPTSQDADFGLLLLVICLTARQDYKPHTESCLSQKSLYIATKVLVAEMHACLQQSSRIIQACALLAMYEYINGKCDEALVTLSSSIRMAYNVGLDGQKLPDGANGNGEDRRRERQEQNNLWWMLVICERLFVLETSNPDQPLLTLFPNEDRPVPSDHYSFSKTQESASSFTTFASFTHISAFGRMAQATELLDTVLKSRSYNDNESADLARIDSDLQSLLSLIMERNRSNDATFCGSFAILIRAMFVFHQHILRRESEISHGNSSHVAASRAVLDTATNMLIEIAIFDRSYASDSEANVDALPPTCIYTVDAAKEHMRRRGEEKWKLEEREALGTFRDVLLRRWSGT